MWIIGPHEISLVAKKIEGLLQTNFKGSGAMMVRKFSKMPLALPTLDSPSPVFINLIIFLLISDFGNILLYKLVIKTAELDN